jgi:integrase
LPPCNVHHAFREATTRVGLRTETVWPRVHDLRHTFAVNTLLGWYRDGRDVAAMLPVLSTYLGHTNPANTYWYLSATPNCWPSPVGGWLSAKRVNDDQPRSAASGVLHRPADDTAPGQPAHHRRLPRHLPTPARLRQQPDWDRPVGLADQRPGRALHRRVPDPPAAGSREQCAHAQRPAGGDPLSVRLPRAVHPEHAAVIQRVLAIPSARLERNLVTYLDHAEAAALLAACNQNTRTGRRDHALFALAIQTGLRISELIGLTVADIHFGPGAHVHCVGKGRKERRTPLLPATVTVLRAWIRERGAGPGAPLFATSTGRPLSRDAVERRIHLAATRAAPVRPSLVGKQVTMHTLRHTAAMRLLHAGVDATVIALGSATSRSRPPTSTCTPT